MYMPIKMLVLYAQFDGFIIWNADSILRLCGFNYLLSNGLCNISRNVVEFAQRLHDMQFYDFNFYSIM